MQIGIPFPYIKYFIQPYIQGGSKRGKGVGWLGKNSGPAHTLYVPTIKSGIYQEFAPYLIISLNESPELSK